MNVMRDRVDDFTGTLGFDTPARWGWSRLSPGPPTASTAHRQVRIACALLLSIAGLELAGCASGATSPAVSMTPAAGRAQSAPVSTVANAPLMTTGPKKRIAVAKFDAHGAFVSAYGGWDIGGGLAAQLTTALANSGQFIVVERAELSTVLREQELGLQRVVSKETAAQVSQVLGAQILVRGSVTEFDQRSGGGGLRLGVGTGVLGGTLGAQTTTGVVAIDLRLIDATTGQVLQSHRAEARIQQAGLTGDINWNQLSFGGDGFAKTVLGQATRQAIERAVTMIRTSTQVVPWTGRVVDVVGDQVYINAGSATGIKTGDVFTVSSVVRELVDPATGTMLGAVEQKLGEVKVVSTQENFSVASMATPFETQRGDLVKVVVR